MNYYNENDVKAAAWLRELIKEGHIPAGDVDERSILEVKPHELAKYPQQHFFAGIGGWSLALKLAGWPEDRPVRTGSCPCQPFSGAGKGRGDKDERHLWPAFRDIIAFGDATITFGEQVASPLGRDWLVGVRADLEALGYEVGAADLCAAGVGAPHIRQRLYWLAYPKGKGRTGVESERTAKISQRSRLGSDSATGGLAHPGRSSNERGRRSGEAAGEAGQAARETRQREWSGHDAGICGSLNGLAHSRPVSGCTEHGNALQECDSRTGQSGAWSNFSIVQCSDGKSRRFEPGSFPLAYGVPNRVAKLRGFGNAIVPQLAAEFIQAACEAIV